MQIIFLAIKQQKVARSRKFYNRFSTYKNNIFPSNEQTKIRQLKLWCKFSLVISYIWLQLPQTVRTRSFFPNCSNKSKRGFDYKTPQVTMEMSYNKLAVSVKIIALYEMFCLIVDLHYYLATRNHFFLILYITFFLNVNVKLSNCVPCFFK